ncbi:c-type cytochrome [Leptothrix sp. BB-4]
MRNLIPMFCAAAAAVFMGTAQAGVDAVRAKALATENACLACHAVTMRVVGPAFSEVVGRYGKDQGDALVTQLADRIRSGGSGKWGTLEMPAQSRLTPADARLLAEWILSGSP